LRVMSQFAVRIGSILLMCFAATPMVAGPRGGASFGGGGAHFGAGAFAAPHIAPNVTATHFFAPSPHGARNIRTPLTAPVAPQLFARPGYLLRHVTPGQVDSAPSVRSVRQIPRPTNQAANASRQHFTPWARHGASQLPQIQH